VVEPFSWHLSVLVLVAVATTAVFMVAVAWDSRTHDGSPWT
jgi:hypothetical protein